MSSAYQPGLHRFAVFTAMCTVLLLAAGASVTSNDAGLAVPDWPLSYGSLMPPMVGGIFYEHGHRIVATTVGFLTIVLAVWLARREPRRWMRRLGWIALAGVIGQGVLGGITVKFFLPAPVSIAHATIAQLFFATVVSLALFTSRWWHSEVPTLNSTNHPALRALAGATVAAIFVQLILGAAFRHRALGILPHALWAVVTAWLGYWTAAAARHHSLTAVPALARLGRILSATLTIQILLGGVALWARIVTRDAPQPMPLAVWTTVAHVVFGALTLAAAVVLMLCVYRVVRPAGAYAVESGAQGATV